MSPISSPLISFLILLPIQRTAINVNHFEDPTIFETQFLIKKWEQRNLNRKTLSKEIFHSVSCANLLICTLQCCCIPFDNANVDELIKVKLKRVLIRLMHQNIIYSRVFFLLLCSRWNALFEWNAPFEWYTLFVENGAKSFANERSCCFHHHFYQWCCMNCVYFVVVVDAMIQKRIMNLTVTAFLLLLYQGWIHKRDSV